MHLFLSASGTADNLTGAATDDDLYQNHQELQEINQIKRPIALR